MDSYYLPCQIIVINKTTPLNITEKCPIRQKNLSAKLSKKTNYALKKIKPHSACLKPGPGITVFALKNSKKWSKTASKPILTKNFHKTKLPIAVTMT